MHAYIHTYIHMYIHTYMHAYIHTYVHTYIHTYIRDNYNSLTSAKLPPKNGDGQLKFICVDKNADKITYELKKYTRH